MKFFLTKQNKQANKKRTYSVDISETEKYNRFFSQWNITNKINFANLIVFTCKINKDTKILKQVHLRFISWNISLNYDWLINVLEHRLWNSNQFKMVIPFTSRALTNDTEEIGR